ncbi:MAG TPA: hypothetical protein VI776_03360 [Anaerolineales bacterium]|nr:hypothetical protein [Anaerolineales bacterium]
MRITPSLLHKIARDTVAQRTRSDRDLLSVYLTGSLLDDDPLLGGTADIDLVFIHNEAPGVEREIQRMSDEVHLDIAHHSRDEYRWPRSLRLHPWLGPTLVKCKILYDPQHFMDFTQASVRSQFNQPDNVIGRARGQAEHAREIWFGLHDLRGTPGPDQIELYLKAIDHVVNGVVSLAGSPLTERRFLLQLPARVDAIGHPGLYPGLLGLLGGAQVDAPRLRAWLPAWQSAYDSLGFLDAPTRLHPDRCYYYRRALDQIVEGNQPQNALWPLLHTWTQAILLLAEDSPARPEWEAALNQLGLLEGGFEQRVAALDAYLDTIEEILDRWARANGIDG